MATVTADKLAGGLKPGNLKPAYFLGGEEIYRKKAIAAKIREIISPDDFNFFACEGDKTPVKEIISLANTPPVFSNNRLIIVNRAEKIKLKDKKDVIEYLANPLETTCLVFLSEEKKKTDALFKACADAGEAAVFYTLRDNEAHAWVINAASKAGLSISAQAAKLMTDGVGTDLNALNIELEKLLIYMSGSKNREITPETVLENLGYSKEENPYDLSGAIMERDQKRAMELTGKLLESGVAPIQLLNIISGVLIKIIKVKRLQAAGTESSEIFTQAGLNYFEKDFVGQAGRFAGLPVMLDALSKSLEYERDLKTSSGAEPEIILKSLIFKMLSGGGTKRA